ncbi:DUF6603 domain-containing protein [Paraburkholderia sp. MM5477-R1]|uniref:DUF6603 domain-containing protein n=1 Tax=Paraburkholderia sp. MM5477-R1 TaxID=2991062 RepID=UPI003D1CFF84
MALQPLESQLTTTNVIPFLSELGLQFPPQLLAQGGVTGAMTTCATSAGALSGLITQLTNDIAADNEAAIVQDGIQLIQQIAKVISGIDQIGNQLEAVAGALGLNTAEVQTFARDLTSNLISYLLVSYLENIQPGVVGVGNILGILDYIRQPGISGDPTHPPFTIRKLQLGNLGKLLSKPEALLETLYGWGDPGFDGSILIPRLSTSLNLLGLTSNVQPGPGHSLEAGLVSIQANPATNPPGLLTALNYPIPGGFAITIPLSGVWSIQIQTGGTLTAGLQTTVTPPATVDIASIDATLNGQMVSNLIAKAPDANSPIILIGQTGGSRMQTDSFSFGMGLNISVDAGAGKASVDPLIQIQVTGGKVVIDTSQADGFIADVLSGIHVEAGFDLKATWRGDTGMHIEGGAQLEIDLPLHLTLGPVTLPTLYIVGGVSDSGIPLEISAALGLELGPLQVSIDRLGVTANLTFPDHGGNLGPADLAIAFKPPNGLGLAIDAGIVAGGGYITFDPVKGQYAGILQLSIVDTIQVVVIGVVDTVLPDGSSGFSLLLVITFNLPPIQLGFGFTLTGVGGLGGMNRTMNVDALRAGFRAHALNSVMFPPDPIANAPRIISDIRNFFPPAQGRYLFGPMLQIGWGTPKLITLTVGVILEVPDPIRIAILGLIDAGLPTTDLALIEVHVDVLGIIDFGAQNLSIDGSLYDSRVLVFSMAGDMAFRLSWGSNPNFVYSMGGFNPHFNTDGLNVPQLRRLSVSIGDGDNPRISSNSYLAVTSNSFQFGANVEAYAAAGGFSIHGYLGFDVLIIISPFSFEFDFYAGFDVAFEGMTLLGLNVSGLLSGPTPFHLHGEATISLLFFSVSASVDLTWGDSKQATLPARPVLPDLTNALKNPSNWKAALPEGAAIAVTLATPAPGDKSLRVHPMGTLGVKESVVPLDLPITRYGDATPSDGTEFSIASVQLNSVAENIQAIPDYFAIGQFTTLSDADKLGKPSFEKYAAGVDIGSSSVLSGQDSPRQVHYIEYQIPELTSFSKFTRIYQMPARVHSALVAQGAGFDSKVKTSGMSKYSAGPVEPIAVQDAHYVVTSAVDLTIRSDIVSESTSFYQAQARLSSYLAIHPEESSTLQIQALHEVTA